MATASIPDEWVGKDFNKIIKRKQEGRKHGKRIGDAVELKCQHYFKDKGFLCIRVPAPKKRSKAYFQQKGEFQKWDVLVIQKAIVIQVKRRQKYMTKSEIEILKKSCKAFPHAELTPELCWLDKGLRFRNL